MFIKHTGLLRAEIKKRGMLNEYNGEDYYTLQCVIING